MMAAETDDPRLKTAFCRNPQRVYEARTAKCEERCLKLATTGAEERVETNKRQTTCPLPKKLVAHLRRARKRTGRYVIEYDGKRVQKLRRSSRSACEAAGLGKDVTPHMLRHFAVTWRLLKGIKTWDVAAYVGMSEKMVHDNYGHHAPDHMQEARDAI